MTNFMEISIREETFGKLGLKSNATFLRFLKTAVEVFCEYNFTDASFVLFKLLYEKDKDIHNKVLKDFCFTLYAEESFDPCIEYYFIEEDSVQPIAEELQFQYMNAHPRFLKVRDCIGCEKELLVLQKHLVNHPLMLYRAVESVWNVHQCAELVHSCVTSLNSEKTASQAKGLESLGHNYKHQQLLLPYARDIGLLLKAMHNTYTMALQSAATVPHEQQLVMAAQEELNSAFAPLAKIWDKVPAEAVPVAKKPSKTEIQPASNDTATKAEPVKNSLITEYSVSPELSKFINNKYALDYLLEALSAHEALVEATNSLVNANKAYEDANANFCKDDMNSLHTLFSAGKAFEEAKRVYASAYADFIQHRDNFENAVVKAYK